jgi:hypothetical protein
VVRLFASRIADAVLEGQQMLTEGGAASEPSDEGGEEQSETAEKMEAESGGETDPDQDASTEAVSSDQTDAETMSEEPENAEVVAAS